MTSLAELERAVRERRDFVGFESAYLHRAWREDSLARVRGRQRIRERALARASEEPAGSLTIDAELRDGDRAMIAFSGPVGRGHRWALYEGPAVAGDIEILDGAARASLLGREVETEARHLGGNLPVHLSLGELRAGRGQLAEADTPILAPDFPAGAQVAARYLHRVWNRRDLGAVAKQWRGPAEAGEDGADFVLETLAALPDAVLLIEAAIAAEASVAVLWRLHGHHLGNGWGTPSGRRVRAIGSSVLTLSEETVTGEDMLVDTLAMRAATFQPLIDYAT